MKPATLSTLRQGQAEILAALEKASSDRHQLATDLHEHTQLDTARFDAVTTTLTDIHTDVKSLLATRSFQRGAFWMLGIIGTAAGVISGLLMDFFRHPH